MGAHIMVTLASVDLVFQTARLLQAFPCVKDGRMYNKQAALTSSIKRAERKTNASKRSGETGSQLLLQAGSVSMRRFLQIIVV
jgi:hypothetical protein